MANTDTAKLPPMATQELGGSGTYFFKGYITAEEYSIDLQGKYALQVYDVMRRSDATIRAALQLIKQPILAVEWKIEAASNEAADQEVAERANYEFFNRSLNFYDVTREGMNFLDFGYYVGELVYETATYNGKPYIGIKSINSRKQRSILKWEMDDGTPGVTQILPTGKYVDIPRQKLMVCVNDQEGENYYGVSILRYCYKPWKLKDGLEIMNAVALENMGMGIPYIRKGIDGRTVDEGELQKVRDLLRNQRINEEAFWEYPDSVEVGFTDMKGQTTKEIIPTIEYQDRQILLSVLGQFLLLGTSGGGSRAVSQDHSRIFVKALQAVARQWCQSFQQDVLNRWVDLNYSNLTNGYPKLVFSSISDEDTVATSNAVSTLMAAGALHPDRDIENRLRALLNLPPLGEEDYQNYDDLIKPPTPDAIVAPSQSDPVASGTPDKPDDGLPDETDSLTAKEIVENARAAQKQLFAHLAAV